MSLPHSFHDKKVCVLGLGYVGLTLAAAMADSGFQVLGVEISKKVRDKLAKLEPHFYEPRLQEKLARVSNNGSFSISADIDPAFGATVYIITVGTPLKASGQVELDFIRRASRQVAAALRDGDLVVLRSTVQLGTARTIVMPVLDEAAKRYELAVCPERTLEGQALLELHALPQIIGADSPDTRFRCSQLFSMLTPTTVNVSKLEAAELVKLVDNTFRDVSFAFANEVAKLASRVGVSAREIITAGKLGYPRTNVAWPGPVGGPCLEKDPHILAESAARYGVEMTITKAARRTNELQPGDVARLISAKAAMLKGFSRVPRIAILGLAFKGMPATDDLRGTMARPILKALRSSFPAAEFVGFDSVVAPADARAALDMEIETSLEAAISGADLVVIANNHPTLRNMDVAALARMMKSPAIVYDFWNMFDDVADSMPAGVCYMPLGSENVTADFTSDATTRSAPSFGRSPRRYVVTGGTGFIGSALVRRLVQEGHAVRVIDNDFRGRAHRLDSIAGRFEHVTGDVRDATTVSVASRGADSVLHLAAINGTENFYQRPELVLDVGIRGMQSVLEACRVNGIPQFLLMSSSEVYQTPPDFPTPETVPLTLPDPWNPRYSYGGSKIISEVMLGCFHHDALKKALIVRPHNVYGPDMGYEHVLPQLIMKVAKLVETESRSKLPFTIQGTGEQTRSFIHVSDFIDGVMLVLEKGQHREVYHVGTEDEVPIRHVVEEIFRYFKRDFELVKGPLPAGGTLRRCPSIQKVAALGFAPQTTLTYGIAEMAEWYLSNRSLWPVSSPT